MSTSTALQIVEPKFIHKGGSDCCPIPRDGPNIMSVEVPAIKTKSETGKEEFGEFGAQLMMEGGENEG
ncbi:hypothetical protein ADUPG1_011760, partial [Aduncisulcus paluster]